MRGPCASLLIVVAGCSGAPSGDAGADALAPEPDVRLTVVTVNTGTTAGLPHDAPPDDGYGAEQAAISDTYYGDGLAWPPAIDALRAFFEEVDPDVVVFQEIFHPSECAVIPVEHHAGFVCEGWSEGDPSVAQLVLGMGYQVACHLGKPDKCAAVHRRVGAFRGCDGDLCLDGLDGAQVEGCGSGSRVGRGVIELASGGSITLVNLHGSSGIEEADSQCRVRQVEQVFVDLDGAPAASGEVNLVMGDLNTDPGRLVSSDPSAARWNDFVGDGLGFHFVTEVGRRATPTYATLFNIDHVVSDALDGECWAAGITEGRAAVIDAVYFDHVPIVCEVRGDLP